MSVYVDDVVHPFGRMKMCHCWADSDDELLAMMRKIGVQAKWIQGHPTLSFGKHKNASWVHFDIAKNKRDLALQNGAIACDKYEPLIHTARLDLKHPDPYIQAYGKRRLALAYRARGGVVFRFSERYFLLQRTIHHGR